MTLEPRQIEKRIGTALTFLLTLPRFRHQRRSAGAVFAWLGCRIQCGCLPRDGQVQINPIQQRP